MAAAHYCIIFGRQTSIVATFKGSKHSDRAVFNRYERSKIMFDDCNIIFIATQLYITFLHFF